MFIRRFAPVLGAALLALPVCTVHAQASDTNAAPQASAAAAPSSSRAANHALARRVRKALYSTKGLAAHDITVVARNGVVTLTGTVPEQSQVDLAGSTAQHVAGVQSVTNHVQLYQKN
ncbi:BON domain-containing protein [Pararobbsia silviterrae]|uniref:BON domain-containing protein n=1 Tax=Pararobbsia silviterrae TaxID=1792498 RepID=A0A494XZT5_9BURK|nr:BON domain-containing protein [Pararobbsia silviterrae]RKP54559.1 BON domain-containing protein [Pararobbsia silviterrae]